MCKTKNDVQVKVAAERFKGRANDKPINIEENQNILLSTDDTISPDDKKFVI